MSKRPAPPPSWTITFDDPSPLKAIVEAVSNVTRRASFKVVKGADTCFYLKVNSADSGYVCCIAARIKLDNVQFRDGKAPTKIDNDDDDNDDDDDIKFCVDCKEIAACLSNILPQASVVLEGDDANATVSIRSFELDTHAHEVKFTLSAYTDDDHVKIKPIDFKVMLELDVIMLKQLLRLAKTTGTEKVRLRVYFKDNDSTSVTVFSINGKLQAEQKFCADIVQSDDGSTVVRAAPDGSTPLVDVDGMQPEYDNSFLVDKLEGFLKTLQCRMIVSNIMPGSKGHPLMFNYRLGGSGDDSSHIRFLIAPSTDDE